MKSKSFILLALLTAYSFTATSQNLTLEQTVEYVNTLLKSNSEINFKREKGQRILAKEIKVDIAGRITIQGVDWWYKTYPASSSFNVFDLESAIWTYDKEWSSTESVLLLKAKNNVDIGSFARISTSDGNRLYKAIMHLKNVCNKSADPFGN